MPHRLAGVEFVQQLAARDANRPVAAIATVELQLWREPRTARDEPGGKRSDRAVRSARWGYAAAPRLT